MKKVIVSTSANPLHYGHLGIYKEAINIFGKNNTKIVIGKNARKSIDFDKILYHIIPYRINFEIAEGITLSDYCNKNKIHYIVRGIRNAVDAEYELKLDFLNKEINNKIQTIFFPTKHIFSNISSSSINELIKYNKLDIVKKYMNEDAMYRYVNGEPEFIIFFGKSCIGKTFYLEHLAFKDKNVKTVNIDNIFWKIFEQHYGTTTKDKVQYESKQRIYNGYNLNDLTKQYSNNEFWQFFFHYIENNFTSYEINNFTKLNIKNKVYLLDFPSIGAYWNTIPSTIKGKMYLIKLNNHDNDRRAHFIENKNFKHKIDYLDSNYYEPNYFDEEIDISKTELI